MFIDLLAGKDHANHIATKRTYKSKNKNTSSLHPVMIRVLQAEGTGTRCYSSSLRSRRGCEATEVAKQPSLSNRTGRAFRR